MAWAGWTPEAMARSQLKALVTTGRRRSKYASVPYWVLPTLTLQEMDNLPAPAGAIAFPSKREASRYAVLKHEQNHAQISDLVLQKTYALNAVTPDGVAVKVGTWSSDFEYVRDGVLVCEDCKGVRTPLYAWKRRHFELQYARRVLET